MFIFTSTVDNLPIEFTHEVCKVEDKRKMADKLKLANDILQHYFLK
ncbi:MAG: hypothetical protein M0R40_04815 [Firmicutes bacterium]|nr:hypothetical protein [Bacillota bacterium]